MIEMLEMGKSGHPRSQQIFFERIDGLILVFDLRRVETFQSLDEHVGIEGGCPRLIIATHSDTHAGNMRMLAKFPLYSRIDPSAIIPLVLIVLM